MSKVCMNGDSSTAVARDELSIYSMYNPELDQYLNIVASTGGYIFADETNVGGIALFRLPDGDEVIEQWMDMLVGSIVFASAPAIENQLRGSVMIRANDNFTGFDFNYTLDLVVPFVCKNAAYTVV